jgi:hypothetical protein
MPAIRSLIALLVCATLGLAEPAKVRTLAGKEYQGELLSLDGTGLTIKAKDNGKDVEIKMPLADVLEIDLATSALPANKYIDVELVDGTLLHCGQMSLVNGELDLKLVAGHEVKVPLASVSYVLNNAQDKNERDDWKRLLSKQGSRDFIAIKKEGVSNTLEGTLGQGDAEGKTIGFEPKGSDAKVRVRLERIHGMSFFRKREGNLEDPLCKLTDTSGNVLVITKIAAAGGAYTFTTGAGVKLEYPGAQLAKLDFSKGKLTYLSDLEPTKTESAPGLEGTDRFKRDKNLDGGGLRISGVPLPDRPEQVATIAYPKGLAIPATTELIYDIGGEYKHFKAVIGFDDQVAGDSNVKVLIEGDGRELFKTEIKRKDKKALPVVVDVKNVKNLRIVVSSSDLLDLGYHINIADAKVSK